MRSCFLRVVFVLFIFSLHQGNATRYLPFIVWDHLNPMLSCKYNWFHDMIIMMEIYDRFDFICPTTEINIKLLDTSSRPTDQMNENIFQRKWKGNVKALKDEMESGKFCDPCHNETKKVFTCEKGEGQTHTIRIEPDKDNPDKGFYKDDIVVFFNNGDDGRVGTLNSKEKKCTMALVVKVTWLVAKNYDFSYGKELNTTNRDECKRVHTSCKRVNTSPNLPSSITEMSSTIITTNTIISKTVDKNVTGTIFQAMAQSSNSNCSREFKEGLAVGFAGMFVLALIVCLIFYSRFSRTSKRKKIQQGQGVTNEGYHTTMKR